MKNSAVPAVDEDLEVNTRSLPTLGCTYPPVPSRLQPLGYRKVRAPQIHSSTHRAVWLPRAEHPQHKPKWAFIPRSVSYAASGIREECCITSCFRKNTQSSVACMPINFRMPNAAREKQPRPASVHLLHDSARPHEVKEMREKLEG